MKFLKTYKSILLELQTNKSTIQKLISKFGSKPNVNIIDLINKFEKFKSNLSKKNIFQYKSWTEIENELEISTKTKTQDLKLGKNIKPIFQNKDWILYNPQTHGESCELGKNTKWCISMKKKPNHWISYVKEFINFYVLINKNTNKKYAIAGYPNNKIEIYNSDDKQIRFKIPDEINPHIKISDKKEKLKKLFSKKNKSIDEIKEVCEFLGLKNYKITNDGFVNVNDNVDIFDMNLENIPIKFEKVAGDFICFYNKLESLEGSPTKVGGNFDCDNNKLVSLEGSPNEVAGDFICSYNKLVSLEGSPTKVGGNFYCDNNKLTKEDIEWLKQNSKIKGKVFS